MSVESVFEAMPVDESSSSQAPSQESGSSKVQQNKGIGDRILKGNTASRIEAFSEILGDDDYGGGKPKEHEQIKVEKEKTSTAKPVAKEEGEEAEEEQENLAEKKIEKQAPPPPPKPAEIPKDAKVKVKIDGIDQEVSIEELKNGYSGKQAITKRFTELDNAKKSFAKEKEQVLADGHRMREEIAELKNGFESVVNEFSKNGFVSKNPMHLVEKLLDRVGVDSYAFNKAMFEYHLPEYLSYFEMDDVQREAYDAKKENEYLRKKEQTFTERTRQAQANEARQREEFNLIKKSGLSIDEYNQHFEELQDLGGDTSVETVLEFAKVKPVFDKAGNIVSKTQKAGDVQLIQNVAKLLMEFPTTTEEEIIEHITGRKAAKDVAKKLERKEGYSVDTSTVAKKSQSTEFSDEDMEMFRQIKRR